MDDPTRSYPLTGAPGGHPPQPYSPDGYPPQDYLPPGRLRPGHPPAPRRSNVPLTAVIVACVVLLCGGTVTAGVLVVRNVIGTAKKAVDGLPSVPTALPTDLPGLPTDLPSLPAGLPTGLPNLPTDLPGLPGLPTGAPAKVSYRVDGDGPISISYLVKTDEAPKTVRNAKLPWRLDLTMSTPALATVVALRTDTSSGPVHCRIIVDGKQVAESSHDAAFAVATCTKLIGG